MGQYSGWTDLKHTPDISDPGAIHGHLYDALVCTRKVAVVAILKLEALVTVPASIPLVTCLSFSVLNDIGRLLAMDTGNLNYSHKELKRQEYIRSTALMHHPLLVQEGQLSHGRSIVLSGNGKAGWVSRLTVKNLFALSKTCQ